LYKSKRGWDDAQQEVEIRSFGRHHKEMMLSCVIVVIFYF